MHDFVDDKVAIYSGENLHKIVTRQEAFSKKDYVTALKEGFLKTDQQILSDEATKNVESGCTATTAIIADNKIICANAGDSRTVLGIKGTAKPLSYDHKPQNEGERARISAAGGYVEVGRVNGNLALSRAVGDFEYKQNSELPAEEQIVTVLPDIIVHDITPDDEFLILACDGIWDCLSSQQAVEFIRREIAEGKSLAEISETVLDTCLAPASSFSGIGCDNMSIVIVALLNGQTKEEWYETIRKRVDAGDGPVAPKMTPEEIQNYGQQLREAEEKLDEEREREMINEEGVSGSNGNIENEDPNVNAITLQSLLANSTLTQDNGVIYLDSHNATDLLASLGINPNVNSTEGDISEIEEIDNSDAEDAEKIEEVTDDDIKIEAEQSSTVPSK